MSKFKQSECVELMERVATTIACTIGGVGEGIFLLNLQNAEIYNCKYSRVLHFKSSLCLSIVHAIVFQLLQIVSYFHKIISTI